MRTLIIDDSKAMRRILGKIMTNLGFEISEAENGRKGLECLLADEAGFDVILVDWNMPEMTGLEFIEDVRSRDEYANQKLVMVTTETEPARMVRALMAGVDEFVMKPFTPEILFEKLKLIGVPLRAAASI
ncbi:MAG: response regulator [Planctomycetota bacterium]